MMTLQLQQNILLRLTAALAVLPYVSGQDCRETTGIDNSGEYTIKIRADAIADEEEDGPVEYIESQFESEHNVPIATAIPCNIPALGTFGNIC